MVCYPVRTLTLHWLMSRSPSAVNDRPEMAVADAVGNVTLYALHKDQVSFKDRFTTAHTEC